jgi:hypothetical protein
MMSSIDINGISKDGWYEYDGGMIVCGECVLIDLEKTAQGLLDDAPVTRETIIGVAETPAQCDGCLKQSDDYDSVLDDD